MSPRASSIDTEQILLRSRDHREFLSQLVGSAKSKSRAGSLSLRALARMAGFSTPATLSMIASGQRRFTRSSAMKLAGALKLVGPRRRLLLAMSSLDTACSGEERLAWQERILELRGYGREGALTAAQYQVLSNWVYPTVYVLAGMPGFRAKSSQLAADVAARLGRGVEAAEVQCALRDLEALGMLRKDAKTGRLVQTTHAMTTGEELRSVAVNRYHRQMGGLALEALDLPVEMREFNGLTLPVAPQQVARIKEKIRKFRRELNELTSREATDGEVYQLNLQFFPITVSSGEKK